jgi:TnpA family transposase
MAYKDRSMAEPPIQLSLPDPSADIDLPAAWEARRLRPLLQLWTPETLSRVFFLSTEDRAQVQSCRGSHNRLGFALQLVLMRFLNIVLPDLSRVPEPILHFVSLQIDVNPVALMTYATRSQTRDAHSVQIRDYLGLRLYAAGDAEPLQGFLVQRAMHRDDAGVLIAEAEDWLRRNGILFPAVGTLQRLVGAARSIAEAHIHAVIQRQLTPACIAALDALLNRSQGRRGSTFAWIKAPAPTASSDAILMLRDKRKTILATDVMRIDLSTLNRNRVRQLAALGQTYHAGALKRFDDAKCRAILVCLLQERGLSVTDDLVAMLDVLIGRIFTSSARERDNAFAQQGKAINTNLRLFRSVAAVLLDLDIADDEVRTRAFALVPQAQLQQAYAQSATLVQPDDFNSFAFLAKRYAYLRSFLGDVLEAVPFTGTDAAKPTLEAISFIRQLDATKPKWKKLPPETPCAFVPDAWVSVVCPAPTAINHQLWMLCLAEQLRNQLRSADILVPGSRQHQEWTSYLHSAAAWRERRASWFDTWYGPPDVNAYLAELEERFETLIEQVTEGWEQNTFARIEDNTLVLSRDEKIDVPASARALRQAAVELLPRMKL